MVHHLDIQMSEIGEMSRFSHELLDKIAWAADVSPAQLALLKIEPATHTSSSPGPSAWDASYPASYILAEIEVQSVVSGGEGSD